MTGHEKSGTSPMEVAETQVCHPIHLGDGPNVGAASVSRCWGRDTGRRGHSNVDTRVSTVRDRRDADWQPEG